MIKRLIACLCVAVVVLVNAPRASGATTQPAATTRAASAESLDDLLEPIRAKHKLPGLVAAIVEGDDVVAIGAAGVRKLGSPEPMTTDDHVHLGSCTKAMTATMLARLVERKQLTWESTVAQVFPDLAPKLHADFRGATVEQLLAHRAGLPQQAAWVMLGLDKSTIEQRINLIKIELGKPPQTKPGTFEYSNIGYGVAAAMAERTTGRTWEQLIQAELFDPLGMTTAGQGAPGTPGQVDQPWGHVRAGTRALPVQGDNTPVVGPAGRVHCSMRDWAKFISLHLRGERGAETAYLSRDTFARLHRPVGDDGDGNGYALGWAALQRPWGGTVLTHAGSNTMWMCVVWISPQKNFAVLAATNIGGDEAGRGCDDAAGAMIGRYFKMRPAAATTVPTAATLPTTRRGG